MNEELDSVVCDGCGESMLIGHDELVEKQGCFYHEWCYEEMQNEHRAALAEARATMDKWEEEV